MLRSVIRLEELLGAGFDTFAGSWQSQSAAVRELEIIGEAAGEVSEDVRGRHPQIPWKEMRGFSSFAKHEYWRVNPERLWKALQEMPALRVRLSRVVP